VVSAGETYNINADWWLATWRPPGRREADPPDHVEGIAGQDGKLVSTLTKREAERLITSGVIEGGMLPKVESALRALAGGAQKAHIIDGRVRTRSCSRS